MKFHKFSRKFYSFSYFYLKKMYVLLVLLLCITYSVSQQTSFQASGLLQRNGHRTEVTLNYDFNAKKFAQTLYFPDGTTTREVIYYDRGIQLSMCSDTPDSCQSIAWNVGQWVWFVNSSQIGISDNWNGNAALRYNIQQPNGWNSTLWFSQINGIPNKILRATMSKGNNILVSSEESLR